MAVGILSRLPAVHPMSSVGAGGVTFGNETVAQLTTNPPTPHIGSVDNSRDTRYRRMNAAQRLAATHKDAAASIWASMKEFVRHPIKNLAPALVNGASSTVQPILHPIETAKQIGQYYKTKGFIDGTFQALYTLTNVAGAAAIAAGIGAVGLMVVGAPVAAAAGGVALTALEIASAAGLIASFGQFLYDEAQTAAPEEGVKLPNCIPLIGGKYVFHPTNHQQQAELLKFDLLNAGGSALMLGFAKLGHVSTHPAAVALGSSHINAATLARSGSTAAGKVLEKSAGKSSQGISKAAAVADSSRGRQMAAYAGLTASEAAIAAGNTPLPETKQG